MVVVNVIGAGLAGSEAAWQLAKRGIDVHLYEMRPQKLTPAHHTGGFAELVCSNSLRSNQVTNAVGLLKEEMRRLDSLIIAAAEATAVPAGGALAVDRNRFSAFITDHLRKLSQVTVISQEVTTHPQGITVIATGPLTSAPFSQVLQDLNGASALHFFDAVAPIVLKSSIDFNTVYLKSRYDRGPAAYLNCPMTKDQFLHFQRELISAKTASRHQFENDQIFEGCMPIEVMAKRGERTLLFGPLKPVGLIDPHTQQKPYAVVQLRQDNASGSLYNLVGFQTHLKFGEQRRVFRLIPGLEQAEFARYGVMHRNTFINAPCLLDPTYQSKQHPSLFFAGQMTGVEGYVESTASGLLAGINAAGRAKKKAPLVAHPQTMIGAMAHYITHANPKHFQPMNANFGLVPSLAQPVRNKKERQQAYVKRALEQIDHFAAQVAF